MSQFLDHIDGLELVEVRQIMDILSFMAHSRPEAAGTLASDQHPTTFANVSVVDLFYRPVHAAHVFDL